MKQEDAPSLEKQILVIDDDIDISGAIAEAVGSVEGRAVFQAAKPSEAYMRSIVQKFDLVIADYRMPGTDGADLVKVIRKQKMNSHAPVIMVSGYPEEVMDRMSSIPNVRVVTKPFELDQFLKLVEEVLRAPVMKGSSKSQFDLDVLNEFVNAAQTVIKSYVGDLEVKIDKPFLYSQSVENKKFMSFRKAGLVNLQSNKFRGTLVLALGEGKQDASIVIAQIHVLAKESLQRQGIHLTESVLKIIDNSDHGFRAMVNSQLTMVIPVLAPQFEVHLLASSI